MSNEGLGLAGHLSTRWAMPHLPGMLRGHLSFYLFGCSIYSYHLRSVIVCHKWHVTRWVRTPCPFKLPSICDYMGFPGSLVVKNPPAKQETRVRSLGCEDPMEKETHSSILAWEIPWTKEPHGYSPWDGKRVRHSLATKQWQVVTIAQMLRAHSFEHSLWAWFF